ncbi:MAG TPA: hypothetical protein VGH62_09900 [Bradyrhizobium sp.]
MMALHRRDVYFWSLGSTWTSLIACPAAVVIKSMSSFGKLNDPKAPFFVVPIIAGAALDVGKLRKGVGRNRDYCQRNSQTSNAPRNVENEVTRSRSIVSVSQSADYFRCSPISGHSEGRSPVPSVLYVARQIATLLRFAKETTDSTVAVALIEKAADLKEQVDDMPPPDNGLQAPDVEPRA